MKKWVDSKNLLWLALGLLALVLVMSLWQGGGTSTMTSEEQRVARVLSAMAGAGKVEVALFYAKTPEGLTAEETIGPTGAVVVAQGAEDMGVRLSLIRAVRTLLSLPETAVDVFVMEEGR